MATSRALRRQMVDELERLGCVTRPAVRKAFLAVPRERFLPEVAARDGVAAVYQNRAIVTRTDARGMPTSSSSEPAIMAVMVERLDLRPGHRVLEIGTGTGYNAALLAALVGPGGDVTSVELEPDLAAAAADALRKGGHSVRVVAGDGAGGWPAAAPFDRVMATASTASIPEAWPAQLVDGGLLEVPLHLPGAGGQQAVVTFRKQGGSLESVAVVGGGFMSLRGPDAGPGPAVASVSVNESVGGRPAVIAHLAGPGLGSITPAARRRLAVLVLTPPRTRRLAAGAADRSPGVFLSLARRPGFAVVTCFRPELRTPRRWAEGTASRDGRSLALLVGGGGGRLRLETYGDQRAEAALVGLLAEWRAAGRPAGSDLVFDVRLDRPGPGVVRARWRDGAGPR